MIPVAGDQLTVTLPKETSDFPPEDIPINVIFEDDSLLVINQTAGICSTPNQRKALPYHCQWPDEKDLG